MNTFPKPLEPEEEKKYLISYSKGDKAARNILIERNLRLVAHVAKKYNVSDKYIEDVISVGTIGLIKAIDSFDTNKKIKLATYASRCIENEILMLFRTDKKLSREVYMQDTIGKDNSGNEISLIDVIESETVDVVDRIDLRERIQKLYEYIRDNLTDRERSIIKMRYGLYGQDILSQREIALKLGISRSYVSRIEKMALIKLKACYDTHEKDI